MKGITPELLKELSDAFQKICKDHKLGEYASRDLAFSLFLGEVLYTAGDPGAWLENFALTLAQAIGAWEGEEHFPIANTLPEVMYELYDNEILELDKGDPDE